MRREGREGEERERGESFAYNNIGGEEVEGWAYGEFEGLVFGGRD